MQSDRAMPADVLLRVEPRLLSDALCVVMREAGMHVSVCPVEERRVAPRAPRRFDLAVVTHGVPDDAACAQTIRIGLGGEVVDDHGRAIGEPGVDHLLVEVRRVLERPDSAELDELQG